MKKAIVLTIIIFLITLFIPMLSMVNNSPKSEVQATQNANTISESENQNKSNNELVTIFN